MRKVKAGYGQHLGLIAAAGVVGGGYPLCLRWDEQHYHPVLIALLIAYKGPLFGAAQPEIPGAFVLYYAVQPGPLKPCAVYVASPKVNAGKVGIAEVCPLKAGVPEVRPHKGAVFELAVCNRSALEIAPVQPHVFHVPPLAVQPGKIGAGYVRIVKAQGFKAGAAFARLPKLQQEFFL